MRVSKKTIGGEIVNRDRDHEPFDSRRIPTLAQGRAGLVMRQNVVRENRFLDISACVEQLAGGRERLGDLGDDSRGAENRELRAERREQVTAMTLSPMIGMDGDRVDEVPEGRLAPIRTPIGSGPEKATMQLLHQT